MQGLKRINRQQSQVIRVPERVLQENQKLRAYQQELTDELGREPSDAELTDKLGFSMARLTKIRKFQAGMVTGQADARDPLSGGVASRLPGQHEAEDLWANIVYQELNAMDQQIMEWTGGMNGHKPLSNQEIAKRLGRSPGAITQRKAKIQQLLDQEQKLSPFVAR